MREGVKGGGGAMKRGEGHKMREGVKGGGRLIRREV